MINVFHLYLGEKLLQLLGMISSCFIANQAFSQDLKSGYPKWV